MEKNHTAEPWSVGTWADKVGVWGKAGDCIAVCDGCSLGDANPSNAARIVTCVNACAGINPNAVPGLVAALEQLVKEVEAIIEDGTLPPKANNHDSMIAARAALAAAKGVSC